MLEYQANDASEAISLDNAHYPGREGNLVDFLYARKMFATLNEDEEMAEVGSADDEELVEPEFEDDDIPLEDDEAVKAAEEEMFGKDQNITKLVRDIQLEDQKQGKLSEKMVAAEGKPAAVDATAEKETAHSDMAETAKSPQKSALRKAASKGSLRGKPCAALPKAP
jgi:hypothetical protein